MTLTTFANLGKHSITKLKKYAGGTSLPDIYVYNYDSEGNGRPSIEILHVVVIIAALLCALVTGLLFGFVVVAMPGIGTLADRDFLRGFRVMDRVIQDGHPLFMAAWVGSVLAVVATAVLGVLQLDGSQRALAVAAAAVYLLGVQLPTAAINIPMNNTLQALELESMDDDSMQAARLDFEERWNRWNAIRTALGVVATVLLLILLLQLTP